MVNEETRRKLRELNLGEAVAGLEMQQSEPGTIGLPFDERLQRLVDYIYQEKYNSRIQRLIKAARLRFPQANVRMSTIKAAGSTRICLPACSAASTSPDTRASSSRALPVQERPIWPVRWANRPACTRSAHGISGYRIF